MSFYDHFFITGLNCNGNLAGHMPTEYFELPVRNLLSHLHPGLIDGGQIFFAQFDLFKLLLLGFAHFDKLALQMLYCVLHDLS